MPPIIRPSESGRPAQGDAALHAVERAGDGLPDVVEVVRLLGDPGRTVFRSSFPAIRPMTRLRCRG